jgi:hypothetical protein
MIEEKADSNSATSKHLMKCMEGAQSCSSRYEVIDWALRSISNQGLICEFGVFEGESINYIAKKLPNRSIFGFDSFEGLPEDWRTNFEHGAFSTGGRLPQVQQNVTLLKGWFDATLRLIPLSQVHRLMTDRPRLRCAHRPDEIRWLSCDGVAVA